MKQWESRERKDWERLNWQRRGAEVGEIHCGWMNEWIDIWRNGWKDWQWHVSNCKKIPQVLQFRNEFYLPHTAYPFTSRSFSSLIFFFSDYQTDLHCIFIEIFLLHFTCSRWLQHHTTPTSPTTQSVFYMYTVSYYCSGRNGMVRNTLKLNRIEYDAV